MADACDAVRAALRAGPLTDDQRAHAAACAVCGPLAQVAPALGEGELAPLDPGLLARVEADQAAEAGPLGRLLALPTPVRAALALLAGLPLAGWVVARFGVRADWSVYPAARMLVGAGGLLLLTVWNVVAALRGPHRPIHGLGRALLLAGLTCAAVVLFHAAPAPYATDPRWCPDPEHMVRECLTWGAALGLPVLLATLLLHRLATAQAWLFAAAAGGLTANLVLQVHCPIVERDHVLLGHASLAVGFVLVAAVVGLVRRR